MDLQLRERRLLDRATFGPRPGDRDALGARGAEAWVASQLSRPAPDDPDLDRRLDDFESLRADSWDDLIDGEIPDPEMRGAAAREVRKDLRKRARKIARELAGARLVRAVHGRFELREVMLDFWSNHFSVFGGKGMVGALLPHYEQNVLLPHVFGRFEDLLLAVARSPAMLLYLDNWTSSRADLPRFARRKGRGRGGINENYARELLELHTLGIHGGYDQEDVIGVARVFTGWTLESRFDPSFRFRPILHDRDRKIVMGERVGGRGLEEGERLLKRLARHPSTAHHLAHKLALRFISDSPPPDLVRRIAKRYLETEGDIRAVMTALLLSPELADPAHRKLRSPFRFVASCVRETAGSTDGGPASLAALARLGEVPFASRSPDGFPERASHWIDPGAMLERMSIAFLLARGRVPGTRLGSAMPEGAKPSLASARMTFEESQSLALAAPEFQWV